MKKLVRPATRLPKAHYHPGNLTSDESFTQSDPPPMNERIVTTTSRPILYDADDRPIYRKAGFSQ